MFSVEDAQRAALIFKLLRNGATSLTVVRDFLKAKGLTHSASNWDDLYGKRIEPALHAEELNVDDLRNLLRSSEESGHKHVFLFTAPPARAAQLIAAPRVQRVVNEMGLGHLAAGPLDLELPEQPTIVDIRGVAGDDAAPPCLVVKQVETRTTRKYVTTEYDATTERELRIYELSRKRAVNVARLFADGRLELRIAAQDNTTRYQDNVHNFFRDIAPIIPRDEFREESLTKAKTRFWDKRNELHDLVRYTNSEARNEFGYVLNLHAGTQENNICDNEGSQKAIESFLHEEGYVTKSNMYFILPGDEPRREVHVLLSGDVNEFAITASCSSEEYEYVLQKIREFN